MATLNPEYATVIAESQTMMTSAVTNFSAIGAAATAIANGFPFGAIPPGNPPPTGNGGAPK